MADLINIQDRIDRLTEIIDEVIALQPDTPEAFHAIKDKADIWKQDTDAVLNQECPEYSPELEDFHTRWSYPLCGSNLKTALIRKLRNASTDLRHYIREIHREETFEQRAQAKKKQDLPEIALTDFGKEVCQQYGIEPAPRYFKR